MPGRLATFAYSRERACWLSSGAGRVGYIFYIFHLSSLSNVLSFGRWLKKTEIVDGWVGRWCWVASIAGASYYFGILVGQGPAVLAAGAGRVGCSLYFFIPSILSSFSNASSVGRRLDILKYCGLGRYNPAVVVSYYRRRAR